MRQQRRIGSPGGTRTSGSEGGSTRTARRYVPARLRDAALALVFASAGSWAGAAEVEGVHFPDSIELHGRTLALNGTGLREVYIIKTWVAALYTSAPAYSAAAVVGDGDRRIAITLLADLSIDRLGRSLLDALRRNHAPEQLGAIEPQIQAFVAALQSIGPTVKGDTLTIDMVQGTTRISFNDMAVGDPIPGPAFRNALLRAFVGDEPVDDSLRRGLLGLPAPTGPGV